MGTDHTTGEDTSTAASQRECATETWSLDKSRIFQGYVFATPGERCRYIGTSMQDRPQWLKKHVGRWRPIEDVRQDSTASVPPVESEIDLGAAPVALNGQTSSHDVAKDGGDEDDVALVDTLAGDRSPSHEPTSPPTPVTIAIENGTTRAALLQGAKVAIAEADGPKVEIAPPGAMRRKRGRSGGRRIKEQKRPGEVAKARRMELMRIVIESLDEYPIQSHAASKAGIHRKTLQYWIKSSQAGDAGYDIEWQGDIWRFHELCEAAMEEGHDKVLYSAWHIAMGTDRKDEEGKPVPKASLKQRWEMMRFLFEWREIDGKYRKFDVPHYSGVLIVGDVRHDTPNKVDNGTATSIKARKWKAGRRMLQKTKV